MSAFDRNPITTDLATKTQFLFTIKRAPSLSYFCQKVKMPRVWFPPVIEPSPSLQIPHPGDHLKYDPVLFTYKVDGMLQNWQEMLNWMEAMTDPQNIGLMYHMLEIADPIKGYSIKSDLTLVQLDNQNQPNYYITFIDAFPVDLTGPEWDATAEEDAFMTSTVLMEYLRFEITLAKNT